MAEKIDGKSVPKEAKKVAGTVDITEHNMSVQQVEQKFGVSVNLEKPAHSPGLSSAEAAKRLAENGPNALSPPKRTHPIIQFLHYLSDLFNVLLIFSGILTYIVYAIDPAGNFQNIYVGAILIGVAFLNALIEFIQHAKSQAILQGFLDLIPSKAQAVRDGKLVNVGAADLVLGDVVFVRLGDKVPADIRVISANDFKVDNSSLTGESEAQERVAAVGGIETKNPLEATNIAFNGSLAVNGEAYGIVIRTGDKTVIGSIANLTGNEKRRASPLTSEIQQFVYLIASVAFLFAVVFFLVGMFGNKLGLAASLNFAIGTFVSFVPEGLPATVTMLLTIAAQRMSKRQVLVKDLQGVETLGAITLLATDKTGTLTRNQMTVAYLWTRGRLLNLLGGDISNDDAEDFDLEKPGCKEFLQICGLCTKSRFQDTGEGETPQPYSKRPIIGDATESGLLRCSAINLRDFPSLGDQFPKVFEIPFNSTNKWMLTIHYAPTQDSDHIIYLKGAPERVLKLCSTIARGEGLDPTEEVLGDQANAEFDQVYRFLAGKGHRVLAFASIRLPKSEFPKGFTFAKEPKPNFPTNGYCFLGLVSLEDPPKHGVREAVGTMRQAGVQVMMVTGDHPLTAEAIAKKINLIVGETKEDFMRVTGLPEDQVDEEDYSAIVIHGEKVDEMTDEDWDHVFDKPEIVFARTSPANKLTIVKQAQARGHIVGVTGDGVNDSPALKKADLGIAMNISGSDVSKEAAAMVLLDDNFASTIHGIEEGRLIFVNLKKSIKYTVTHTPPEVWANLLYILVPIPLPLGAIQIIFIDLGFELFNALSFAYDPPEDRVGLMHLQPRKPVTPASVALLRRKQARENRIRPPVYDTETGMLIEPPWYTNIQDFFRNMVDPEFWKIYFTATEDEILVDRELLSYAYLEIGTIETLAALCTYFVTAWYTYGATPGDLRSMQSNVGAFTSVAPTLTIPSNGRIMTANDQVNLLGIIQSSYFMSIMFTQAWNVFLVKARLRLPWGKFMFGNKWNFLAILFAFGFACFIVYPPFMNVAFGTSVNYPPLMWLVSFAWGFVMFGYVTLRILIMRKLAPARFVEEVEGLQMYATKYTMVSRRDSTISQIPSGQGYNTQRRFSTVSATSGNKRNSVFVPGTTTFDANLYQQQQQMAMQQAQLQAMQNAQEVSKFVNSQNNDLNQSVGQPPSGHVTFG